MHTCPECGNHDMRARRLGGATVHECGLCGASFGDRRAVSDLSFVDEAARRGIDDRIWPLAEALEALDGFELGSCSPGGDGKRPFVELVVTGQAALVEIENVAKSFRLGAGSLRCRWRLEARFEQTLCFVVTVARADALRDAHIDVETLATQLHRNRRLTWWRRSAVDEDGGRTPG